ncbi:rhomboid family intramembrane serine protease [Planctomycetales bacterium ZRK34]|nr:rhomboid family intramembrane serine protease [Planctomycetales bacterium ZRK34]
MVIIPVRTDLKLRHRPWVNITLIAINVIVFIAQIIAQVSWPDQTPWFVHYMLDARSMQWYQFLTYQFLHSGWEHLIFNMVFLYVFGNPLEDRLGPIGYACFYLAGGIVAGLGHVWMGGEPASPIWGASGAVSAVTGAFLVMFPFSRVTLSFYFIESFDVSSIVLVVFSFCKDLIFQVFNIGGVAYMAHLSGNVFGFVVAMGLVLSRALPREPYDLLSLFDRSTRQALRDARSPIDPDDPDHKQRLLRQRAAVESAMDAHDARRAVAEYQRLVELNPEAGLSRKMQLDIADYAMNLGHHQLAAHAYERFLSDFPGDGFGDQVQLILGLIYARHLKEPEHAREHLRLAAERLDDPHRREQARKMLHEVERKF